MEVLADYPINSTENPFDINANGKYFVYLTNRELCFSHLSSDLSDFEWENNSLNYAMPMGYTGLLVLERLFIVNSHSNVYSFSDTAYDKIYTFRYEGFPKEEWATFTTDKMWKERKQDYHRELFIEDDINDAIKNSIEFLNKIKNIYGINNLVILGAGLVDSCSWH